MRIRQLKQNDTTQINQVALIHYEELYDISRMSRCGLRFLREFYQTVAKQKESVLLAAVSKENSVIGFVLASVEAEEYLLSVLREMPKAVFLRPCAFAYRVFRSFSSFTKKNKPVGEAEIVFIAVDKKWKGMGIALQLIEDLLPILRGERISRIHLQVFKNNESARRLYDKLQFEKSANTSSEKLILHRTL